MEKILIIVRGVSGSGKSTFADYVAKHNNAVVCTADDFFYDSSGSYNFNPNLLGYAHSGCKKKCEDAMKENKPVIVGNTSITEKEIKPYIDMAEKYGYKFFSIIVENRHGGVNTHGVPVDRIEVMKNRFSIKL